MDYREDHEDTGATTRYPDPSTTAQNPYPALAADRNRASIGFQSQLAGPASLATSSTSPYVRPGQYGAFPGSQAVHAGEDSDSSGDDDEIHHVTNFSAFNPKASNGREEPAGHAPTFSSGAGGAQTEIQKLAQQFHLRHGDPGHSATPHGWRASPDAEESDEDTDSEVEAALQEANLHAAQPRGRGRGRPRGRPRGRGRGGWRQLLKGTEHEDVGKAAKEPRRARGTGRRARKTRRQADPGPEFRNLLMKANQAFVDSKLEEAADYARQAVQENPEIHQAHALLAEILLKQDRGEDAVLVLINAAVTAKTTQMWIGSAERILEIGGENPSRELLRHAIRCYTDALKGSAAKDDENLQFEIRARKYELQRQMQDNGGARHTARSILRQWPAKTHYLREFAVLCAEWQDRNELKLAKDMYDQAFLIYQDHDTFGDDDDETEPFSHLNIYLELIDLISEPQGGIATCKRLSRWFLGRKEESFWDRFVNDDREFDMTHERRNYVPEFQQGRASRDLPRYGEGLPIDIKLRLGLLRFKMGQIFHGEAVNHLKPLLQYADAIDDYYDMFVQAAVALRNSGFLREAADFYDCVRKVTMAEDRHQGLEEEVWMQMATCYYALTRKADAMACFEVVASRKGVSYTRACARLARLYEDDGQLDRARFLCSEMMMLNRRDLLQEAGVKMMSSINKTVAPLPPVRPVEARTTTAMGTRLPDAAAQPLREIAPAGRPPAYLGDNGYDPEAIIEKERKRKRGPYKKRKNNLALLCGNNDAPEAAEPTEATKDAGEEPALKRPRLQKSTYVPRPSAAKQQRALQIMDASQRARENWAIIQSKWPALKEGKDEDAVEAWVEAAWTLLEDFNAMKVFFPDRDRNLKVRQSQQAVEPFVKNTNKSDERPGASAFLGILFSDWHHLFADLALVYVKSGEQDRCYKVVQDVLLEANVFRTDASLHMTTCAAAVYCYLSFNDSQGIIDIARMLIKANNFQGAELLQFFGAVNRFPFGSNWFASGPTQKFMLRMVKQFDYMAMDAPTRHLVDWSAQGKSLESRFAEPSTLAEPDALVLKMYGDMVAVANHCHSALPYYYRALSLAPDDPCINLSIAAMWVQNSMKRQTDNRQHGITQGLAFLYRYYDLRVADGRVAHLQEAEYNVARMWHYLGLTHLAVPAYERVLGLSEGVRAESEGREGEALEWEGEDFASEAALALQGLYAVLGNYETAMRIAEEWLVI